MKRKLIVFALCFAMVTALLPASVLAETLTEDEDEIIAENVDYEESAVSGENIGDGTENGLDENGELTPLTAEQELEGSASVAVYKKDSDSEDPEYLLVVTDAPTNTQISLDSTHLSLTDQYGESIEAVISGNLYFVVGEEEGTAVSYLMLDGYPDEETLVIIAYGEDDSPLNAVIEDGTVTEMVEGKLVIEIADTAETGEGQIGKIQVNTLCYLDANGTYQQEIIEARDLYEPITYTVESDGTVNLEDIVDSEPVGEFYYGSLDTLSLTSCTQAKVEDGELQPLDESGNPVSGVKIYMVYDQLYSFDVELGSVVNEHTEDNGDAYLWFGDTFYIDQYHSQGVYLTGYTNNAKETADCGVWPMLGRTREVLINNGTYGFDHWMGQDLNTWEKVKAYDGVSGNDTTGSASGKDAGDKNYGIVGPFQFTNGETVDTYTTVRVTGRIGDEFTATEVFGTSEVYMIREDSDYHNEWYNLGSHASDNGKRAWFYWISDFYILNNYQDILEYVVIQEDEKTGEIRLLADEMGEDGNGTLIDVWNLKGLYTKRDSAVKTYMADHEDELTEMGVGFSEYLGWLDHIQLRLYTTVETIINGVEYHGTLSLMTKSYTPTVSYYIDTTCTNIDDQEKTAGSETVSKKNEQECNPVDFSFYINPDEAFDADKVKITVDLGFNGTLYGEDGSKIEFTTEDPFIYNITLTSEQLWEAYDCCPNNTGYDVAINLSEAVKTALEDTLVIEKVWDDDSNAYHSRDNVTAIEVTLERSKDGEDWETVVDSNGNPQVFFIEGDASSDVWSLTLTGADLDINDPDDGGAYQFRIAEEMSIEGVSDGFTYIYIDSFDGEDSTLIVTNTLSNKLITITGEKQWYDQEGNELSDAEIPDSVIIAVLKDGKFYDDIKVTKEDKWAFDFSDLPQFTVDGEDTYTYTVVELSDKGEIIEDGGVILLEDSVYQVQVSEDNPEETNPDDDAAAHYTVTNTFLPIGKDVDADTEDGLDYGDDGQMTQVGATLTYKIDYFNYDAEASTVTITDVLDVGLDFVSADNDGSYDESTRTITWTIESVEPNTGGSVTFEATVNENAVEYRVDNTAYVLVGNEGGVYTNTVTNPLPTPSTPETPNQPEEPETIRIPVTKVWDDENDADGIRPESVTVELYLNGEPTGRTLVLNESNGWSGTFTNLEDKTDNLWTVVETAVEDYESSVSGNAESGFVITNTHTPDEIEVPEEPDTPDESEIPEGPNEPEEPEIPEEPDETEEPAAPENPDETQEPSAPEIPEEPEEPVSPETPEDQGNQDSDSGLPQTGYRWNLFLCIVMLAFGGVLLVGTGRAMIQPEKKRRR